MSFLSQCSARIFPAITASAIRKVQSAVNQFKHWNWHQVSWWTICWMIGILATAFALVTVSLCKSRYHYTVRTQILWVQIGVPSTLILQGWHVISECHCDLEPFMIRCLSTFLLLRGHAPFMACPGGFQSAYGRLHSWVFTFVFKFITGERPPHLIRRNFNHMWNKPPVQKHYSTYG